MPYTRRYKKSKPRRKTYRRRMKRTKVPRAPGGFRNPLIAAKRVCTPASMVVWQSTGIIDKVDAPTNGGQYLTITLANSATGGVVQYGGVGCGFRLADLPESSEYTNLYQRYMIVGVKVKIIPYQTVTNVNPGALASGIILHSVVDYDEAGAPAANETSLATLRQYSSYRSEMMINGRGKFPSRYIRPRIRQSVGTSTSLTDGISLKRRIWLDTDTSTVVHLGWLCLFEACNPDSVNGFVIPFKMELTYYMLFRDPK